MENPIFEKKNVVVTGGAGFIGSHLCERLLKEAKVICIDDFSNSSPQNINHLLQYPDFEFINHDVTKPIDLDKFPELEKFKVKFQGIQEIYHLASTTSPKNFEKEKMKCLHVHSLGIVNVLELAAKYRAKFVFASTSVVYGEPTPEKNIFKESDLGVFNHLSARGCYDEGKRFAETCVETYCQVYGLDGKIARVFNTYGPHMKIFEHQLISDFIVNALEGKDLTKIVNLGGDSIVKMSEVANLVIKMTGSKSKLVFEPPLLFLTRKGAPDLTEVKEKLGWFPLVRLEDGLQKTVDYVIANREALVFGGRDK